MLTNLLRLAGVSVLVAGMVVAVQAPASAAECLVWEAPDPDSPDAQYECVKYDDGGDEESGGGGAGGGGNNEPQCTFFDLWNDFCSGERACYINDPAAIQDVEEARERDTPDLPDKPEDANHLIFTSCRVDADSEEVRTYVWDSEFDEVTLRDRIEAALGALVLPEVEPVFNPPGRTLVNLDTWWWAEGAATEDVVGSEALGMRAVASPRDMVVESGGRSVTCPIVNERSDECVMVYRRAGDYAATVTVAYDIRFELDGEVIEVPAGAEDLTTLTTSGSTEVLVREVQSLVTEIG